MPPLVVDVDDVWPGHDGLDLLHELKRLNPAFKVTLFAVPGRCNPAWCEAVPNWAELAVHGWLHPDAYEASRWRHDDMWQVMGAPIVQRHFVQGFKAPGWQISDACLEALAMADWWVADQHYNDDRRPHGLRVHCEGDGDHAHHHVQDWGSNGLNESWEQLVARVTAATEFKFLSEAVQ